MKLAVALLCLSTGVCLAQADSAKVSANAGSMNDRLAQAKADPKLAGALSKTGQKVAGFCANCHGPGGNSISPDVPNLAGQNPVYLLLQMRKFADGTRQNEFMQGMIKALNVNERVGVALYYSGQNPPRRPASNPALAARGREVFGKNCFRCHAKDGGGGDNFARVAGQQPGYLKSTLLRYRSGVGVRVDPLMAANTKLLTDSDIEALVAYVSSM